MQNSHEIPQPWRSHIQRSLSDAASKRLEAATIEGEVTKIAHTIATEAQLTLPPGWKIALDGSQIIYETPDQPKENPPNA